MGCRRHRNNSIPFDCKGSTTRLNWQLKYSFVQGVKKQKSLEILWINPNWLHNKRCIMGVFRRFLHLTTLVPNSFLIFLVSVVVSIDIADRFIALLSPENNQNTQWSHRPIRGGYCSIWPMRGQTWPSGYNDDPRADRARLSSHRSLNQDARDTGQLSTTRHQPSSIWFTTLPWLKYSQNNDNSATTTQIPLCPTSIQE